MCETSPSANFEIGSVRFNGTYLDAGDKVPGSYTFTMPTTGHTLGLNNGINPAYPIAIEFQYRGDRCLDVPRALSALQGTEDGLMTIPCDWRVSTLSGRCAYEKRAFNRNRFEMFG